eukprot:GGOE01020883.1.p1 GENE.GGOE01020883.1~~GGOE01020883.1.p1  ORF type:complete len:632 (+),score=187.09 GGOE01020883.1:225-1898(+)
MERVRQQAAATMGRQERRWRRAFSRAFQRTSSGGGSWGNGPAFFSLSVPVIIAKDNREKEKLKPQPKVKGTDSQVFKDADPSSLMPHVDSLWMFLHILRLTALFMPLCFIGALAALRLIPQRWMHHYLSFALVRAGPTFIKLGQWIATRPDLFSEGLCRHLGELHTDSPSHPFSSTNRTLVAELGPNYLSEYFESVEEEALHSGCIAQVHRAKLKPHLLPKPEPENLGFFEQLKRAIFGAPPLEPPSNEVVIKVVHPGLRPLVACDLAVLELGMWLLSRIVPGSEWFQMEDALDNFSYTLTEHLDMRREAKHLDTFNHLFAGQDELTFPKPVLELVRPSVLVETFAQGTLISDWIPSASEEDKVRVANIGLKGFLEMLFHYNYIHADLHPGNIIVNQKPDGSPQLVFLDTGMVTVLTERQWVNFVDLYASVIAGDGNSAADLMVERSPRHACNDLDGFRTKMSAIIDEYNRAASASNIHVGMTLATILNTVRRYNVGLESDFASLVVSIIIVDGLGRSLQPDINLVQASRPYVVQWLLDHPSAVSSLIPRILKGPTN